MQPISLKFGGNVISIDIKKFRLLWATDQYMHETIRITKLSQ